MEQLTNTIGTVEWLSATNHMRISVYVEPRMLALPGTEILTAHDRFEEAVTKDEQLAAPSTESDEPLFGTHLREAIAVVRGLRKKQR